MVDQPIIMGVLNITPDSFSDGGLFLEAQSAIDQAIIMTEQGADIIDIGGESTRPGAAEVVDSEEVSSELGTGRKSKGSKPSSDDNRGGDSSTEQFA